jgi:hypothetical protein
MKMLTSKPTEQDLEVLIEGCMEPLHDFIETDSSDRSGKASLTKIFMSRLSDLYLALQRNPLLREAGAYKDFLQSSAPLVVKVQRYIVFFEMEIENLFTLDPSYDPWPEVCWRRSAFEAFKEIYQFTQETDLKDYLDLSTEDFDTEDIDYLIEGYALRDGSSPQSEIPVGTPRSHWWWWGEKAEVV